MKNIVVIPARGGSKRLPGKNLAPLGGIPLLAHSIKYALKNHALADALFVTTDNSEIAACAEQYHANVILRPKELSGDDEPTVSAVQHVIDNCGFEVDNVILLQPTNPLRPEGLLEDAMKLFVESGADSLFTVSRNHHKLGKIDRGHFIPFNYSPGQRSQDLEPLYYENGLLYISSSKVIGSGKIFSNEALPLLVDHPFSAVDIDTATDFEYAQYLFNKYQNK